MKGLGYKEELKGPRYKVERKGRARDQRGTKG